MRGNRLKRFWLLTTSQSLIALAIPALFLIFIPVYARGVVGDYGQSELALQIIMGQIELMVPLIGIWWPLLYIKDYVEGDSVEINWQREGRREGRGIEVLLCILSYVLLVFLIFLALTPILGFHGLEFIKTAAQSIWFAGMIFLCCYLFRSVSLSSLVLVMYHIILCFVRLPLKGISIYEVELMGAGSPVFPKYLIVLAVAILTYIGGAILSKKSSFR